MKRIVVVLILIAFIGAVAFARLTRTRNQHNKAPVKQEQKMEKKQEHKRHCIFG